MQDETQNSGGDAAQEPNNAPDPGAANPPAGEAEGLNQEAPAPEVAPDSAAASTPTDQGAGTFDPSVTMRPEDLMDPASPTDTDPATSTDLGDPAPQNTGVAGPQGMPPVGDELEATDWGGWTEPDPSAPTDATSPSDTDPNPFRSSIGDDPNEDPLDWLSEDIGTGTIDDPAPTDQAEPAGSEAAAPPFPEAVSMPHDVIMDPVPTDQEEAPPFEPGTGTDTGVVPDDNPFIYEPGTGVIPDPGEGHGDDSGVWTPPDQTEAPAQPPNLVEQINPDWPVVEELNGREYSEVQELLEDPSKLTDSEVLEDLSPDQMLAMLQAIGGYLSTPQTSVAGDPEGGEVVEPSVVEDPDVIEEFPHGVPDLDDYEPGTGVIPDPEAGGESAQLPNLADQIDPNWPVVEELNGREYSEVQELLEDPSKLSDLEVLEDLSPQQMQVVMQVVGGYLSTPEPSEDVFDLVDDTFGEPEHGGEVVETAVMPDDELTQEPETGVTPDAEAGDEPVDAPDASGAAVGGAAVGGAAVGAGAVGEAGGLGGLLDGIDFGDIGGVFGFGDETVEDIGEALGIDADDISEIAQDPLGAISEVAEGYLGGIVGESPIGDILEGDFGEAALGALGDSIGGPVEDLLEGDIGEAVLGGLGVSIGGPLGGVVGGALGEVAEDIIEEVPVVGDLFEAAEGITEGLEQAAEEVVDDVFEAAEEFVDDIIPDFDFW